MFVYEIATISHYLNLKSRKISIILMYTVTSSIEESVIWNTHITFLYFTIIYLLT